MTLVNLDRDRLEELALRLFRVVLGQEGAEQEAKSFKEQMKNVPQELRESPLFFTLMASIWLNNTMKPAAERLPVSKDDIYRECVEMLIRCWTRKDAISGQSMLDDIGLSEGDLRRVLQALAYHVHSESGESDDAEFTGGKIMDIVETLKLRRVDIYALRDALAQRAGVIYERAPNRYQYAHRSFQEHLAACYLAEDKRYPQVIAEHVRQQPGLWRNVMELFPSEARWQRRDLWKLVKALLPEKDSALPDSADDPVWDSIFHAARLMTEHLPAEDDLQDMYRPRLKRPLARLVEVGALPPVDRAEMGRLLAQLGDPRAGVGVKDSIPDIAWLPVETLEEPVTLKTDEREIGPVVIKPFFIAKYQVTYAQYQAFIEAEDGYHNTTWWQDFPEGYRPQKLDEQRTKSANNPRDSISWYQAVAFTRWLEAKYGELGLYGQFGKGDWQLRLPTEWEWQWVAMNGIEARKYTWGEWQRGMANTSESGLGRPIAVGMYPHGAAQCGALDMSGNVFEWCLNDYKSPDITVGFYNEEGKVMRGGSFHVGQHDAAASSRGGGYPSYSFDYFGLRLVCCARR